MKGRSFLTLVVVLLVGCAPRRPSPPSPAQLFAEIEIGMLRSEVEASLGPAIAPELSLDDEAWYLPPPRLEAHESPYAPGTIGVRFFANGRVAAKRLNPQFRQR